ncbi:MAG: hypothetical protein L3J43_02450 [Sulfurovum sp.]|nr:hypothetical protein [Sulfurovum sp.]
MNLAKDMKMLHAKKFREGSIKQATFLKSFKKEIFELIALDYKPSEIQGYLEAKLEVTINMNSFYAWLNYTKTESTSKPNKHTAPISTSELDTLSSEVKMGDSQNTLDVLASTDFD